MPSVLNDKSPVQNIDTLYYPLMERYEQSQKDVMLQKSSQRESESRRKDACRGIFRPILNDSPNFPWDDDEKSFSAFPSRSIPLVIRERSVLNCFCSV
ncbi:hypothetical protein CW712_02580 [Candidatus Bathyarchaeota archaeon]|nr:MAG: hypothetical protein CW712_02580 [Candidatus Bathyarchaeota archaeon]